jgi:hypothetical protein
MPRGDRQRCHAKVESRELEFQWLCNVPRPGKLSAAGGRTTPEPRDGCVERLGCAARTSVPFIRRTAYAGNLRELWLLPDLAQAAEPLRAGVESPNVVLPNIHYSDNQEVKQRLKRAKESRQTKQPQTKRDAGKAAKSLPKTPRERTEDKDWE